MGRRKSSNGGGTTGSSARKGSLPPPLGDARMGNNYLMKRITPNLCDFCTIGIGRSMLFYDGAWRQYKHLHQKVHILRYGGRRYKLCASCQHDLDKAENRQAHIKRKLEVNGLMVKQVKMNNVNS